MRTRINIYGVRGSAPVSHKDYMKYGGNTASFTIRTPDNSLIYLDAGTGIKFAETELNEVANKVVLLISHTHADHIVGFGMSKLSRLDQQKGYEHTKLQIIGPNDVENSLSKFYDGDIIWPVRFGYSADNTWYMGGIDYQNIVEYRYDNQEIVIDSTTKIILMQGNHPVRNGVVLFKLEIELPERKIRIIYATDNEFDYIFDSHVSPQKDEFKQNFIEFIQFADLLIAEAQYTKDTYEMMKGYGHSYPEQILDLASEANVKQVIITHHDLVDDQELQGRYEKAVKYASLLKNQIDLKYAIEGEEIIIQ